MNYKPTHSSQVEINLVLRGEMAAQVIDALSRGVASSKPELVRRALNDFFRTQDKHDLMKARLKRLENF